MIPLRVLLVEDSEADALLLLRELRRAGFSPEHRRVDTADGMDQALAEQEWDVIVSDHVMPHFSGPAAIRLLQQKGLDIPIIVVSGHIGEDIAVEAMKSGARDYVLKDNLRRLGEAVKREVRDAQDRRERLKAEKDLRAKEEELYLAKKGEEVKDEFIGMVSHEIKTPLTVIIGALHVAMTPGLPQEEVRDLIQDANVSADALARIVDNLLELSRYQVDRLRLERVRTDIKPVVQGVIERLQTRSAIHRLVADIPSDLPPAIIDRTRMELVIHNLVQNAIKYSPEGGEVRVSACCQSGQLVVGVSDQGKGISPEDQAKLFQDFQRLGELKGGVIPGVGLGLKVCRVLVEAHGGRIWVESSPGKGSSFFFTVPVGEDCPPGAPVESS